MTWRLVLPGVWLFRDSCNVYAIEGEDGMVILNAGTGCGYRIGRLWQSLPPNGRTTFRPSVARVDWS